MIVQVMKPFRERFNYSLFKLTVQESNPGSQSNYSGLKQGQVKFGFKQKIHAYIKVTSQKIQGELE